MSGNFLDMSDEDFMKKFESGELNNTSNTLDNTHDESPQGDESGDDQTTESETTNEDDESGVENQENQGEGDGIGKPAMGQEDDSPSLGSDESGKNSGDNTAVTNQEQQQSPAPKTSNTPAGKDTTGNAAPGKDAPATKKDAAATATDAADAATTPPAGTPEDYKAFYERVMGTFRANGKNIELRNPDEAIRLMQMGANYTLKMQQLQPHRKIITMLENNNLLDEARLSFLIDLEKKNPQAIQKLVKDAGIDPLDIDPDTESEYAPGNHTVTDEEVNFRTQLDELASTPNGRETVKIINSTWDQQSKDVLWSDPAVMATIHQQRESGVYDRIAAEIERQRMFGNVPANITFLHAYKVIGDHMATSGQLADLGVNATPQEHRTNPQDSATTPRAPSNQPVASRVLVPRSKVKNNDRASAASPSRTGNKSANGVAVNPLALADDDFLKMMANRV